MADKTPPPAAKCEQPPAKRKYDDKRDYFTLPRFDPQYGHRHNMQEFWKDRKAPEGERR